MLFQCLLNRRRTERRGEEGCPVPSIVPRTQGKWLRMVTMMTLCPPRVPLLSRVCSLLPWVSASPPAVRRRKPESWGLLPLQGNMLTYADRRGDQLCWGLVGDGVSAFQILGEWPAWLTEHKPGRLNRRKVLPRGSKLQPQDGERTAGCGAPPSP